MARTTSEQVYIHEELSMDEVMVLFTIASLLKPGNFDSPRAQEVIRKARRVARRMHDNPDATLSVRVYG